MESEHCSEHFQKANGNKKPLSTCRKLKYVRQISTPMAFCSTCVSLLLTVADKLQCLSEGVLGLASLKLQSTSANSDLFTHKKNDLFYEIQDFWPFCLNLQCIYSLCINNLTTCTNPQTKTSKQPTLLQMQETKSSQWTKKYKQSRD